MNPQSLLKRLDEIGQSLAKKEKALALIGLGSVGLERDRLDEYSDLDFFAIVEKGSKGAFLRHLDWLESVCPVSYCFVNSRDGYKLLFADGIFCEFAIFEPEELAGIPFAEGQIVWKRAGVPETLGKPARVPQPPEQRDVEWLVGEALTNLYVGMGRDRRGEKLSAMRFIQGYAVDRLLELAARVETPAPVYRDPFANERRFEQRFPQTAQKTAAWMQGYERNKGSALAILDFLEENFPVNPAFAEKIRELCE